MIKFILAFVLTGAIASSALAGVKIGGIIGPRFNNVTVEGGGTTYESNAMGYHLGGLFVLDLLEIIGFRTGLVYTTRDIKSETAVNGTTFKYKEKISYFDIPLNAIVGIPATSLYFFGGIKFGVLSGSSCEVESPAGLSCTSNLTSTNFIFNAGPGYDIISFGVGKISVELEYERGLTNVNNTAGATTKLYTQAYAVNAVALIGF